MLQKIWVIIFPIFHTDFFKISIYRKAIKLFESLFSLLIIIYLGAYILTPYGDRIDVCKSSYFENKHVTFSCNEVSVYAIKNLTYYKFLSPFATDEELGVTGFTHKIFINTTALRKNKQNLNDLLNHELEHVNQKELLGFIKFYSTPKWILEGGAEFFRGKPTIDVCLGFKSWGNENIKQKYFESWVRAYYLLKIKKVSYIDYLRIDNDDIYFDKDIIFSLFCSD